MKGRSRPNSERQTVVTYYLKHNMGVKKLSKHFNIPESTIYHWIRHVAKAQRSYRNGSADGMFIALSKARLKVYYGYAITDACILEDVRRTAFYEWQSKVPFKTQIDLIQEQLNQLLSTELTKEQTKCVHQISNLIWRETKPKTFLKKPTD